MLWDPDKHHGSPVRDSRSGNPRLWQDRKRARLPASPSLKGLTRSNGNGKQVWDPNHEISWLIYLIVNPQVLCLRFGLWTLGQQIVYRFPRNASGKIYEPDWGFLDTSVKQCNNDNILKILKYCTSNDANEEVEVNDGVPKRSSYHRHPTHQSTQHNYWPTSKAIDQHTAHRSYKEEKENKEKQKKISSKLTSYIVI